MASRMSRPLVRCEGKRRYYVPIPSGSAVRCVRNAPVVPSAPNAQKIMRSAYIMIERERKTRSMQPTPRGRACVDNDLGRFLEQSEDRIKQLVEEKAALVDAMTDIIFTPRISPGNIEQQWISSHKSALHR